MYKSLKKRQNLEKCLANKKKGTHKLRFVGDDVDEG